MLNALLSTVVGYRLEMNAAKTIKTAVTVHPLLSLQVIIRNKVLYIQRTKLLKRG
jgi:hypothetical protein